MSSEFDHLALRVDLAEPWLADVGFGELFIEPLFLKPGLEQLQGGLRFRFVENQGRLELHRAEPGANWKQQYDFDLRPRQLSGFAARYFYHQTSPESSFTQKKLISPRHGRRPGDLERYEVERYQPGEETGDGAGF